MSPPRGRSAFRVPCPAAGARGGRGGPGKPTPADRPCPVPGERPDGRMPAPPRGVDVPLPARAAPRERQAASFKSPARTLVRQMAARGTVTGKTAVTIPLLALALLVPLGVINAQAPAGEEPGGTAGEAETRHRGAGKAAPAGGEPAGPAGASAGNQTAVQLYDSWFPQADVPDAIKERVVDHMLNAQSIPVSSPDGQEELGQQAADLIIEINSTTDEALKEQKQRELDLMTVDLLKVGIVVAEKYREDPAMWDELMEEFANDGTCSVWGSWRTGGCGTN